MPNTANLSSAVMVRVAKPAKKATNTQMLTIGAQCLITKFNLSNIPRKGLSQLFLGEEGGNHGKNHRSNQ